MPCACMSPRWSEEALDILELESQIFMVHMWVLGTKPRSSARAASALFFHFRY